MALHEAADFTIRPRLLTIPGDLLCAARAAPFRADTPAMHTPDSPGREPGSPGQASRVAEIAMWNTDVIAGRQA